MKRLLAFNPSVSALCVVSVLLLAYGCGGDAGVSGDTTPFAAAISSYLNDHSMDLKVVEFKELRTEGDTAQAVVSLTHAEGMVGVKVRWTFSFARRGGQWVATRHQQQ